MHLNMVNETKFDALWWIHHRFILQFHGIEIGVLYTVQNAELYMFFLFLLALCFFSVRFIIYFKIGSSYLKIYICTYRKKQTQQEQQTANGEQSKSNLTENQR